MKLSWCISQLQSCLYLLDKVHVGRVICWKDNLEYFKDNQGKNHLLKNKISWLASRQENTHTQSLWWLQEKHKGCPMVAGLIKGFLQGPTTWAQATEGDLVRSSNCFLRILLSCLSRKCHDGGCMVKTRMARFGLTKIWRILTRKPQSLEEAFQWVCAQYNSKESKKLTSFPPTTFCRNAPVWRSNWGSLFLGADIWEGIPSVISIQSISIIPQAQTLQDTLSYLLIFKEVIWHEAWSIILKRSWQQNTFVN